MIAITHQSLLSDLVSSEIRSHPRSVGVLVRDAMYLDPNTLLSQFKKLHKEPEFPALRIAYLLRDSEDAAHKAGFQDGDGVFSTKIEQAEIWRNTRDLEALIVVVARGDESKLSSLEDFRAITTQHLKNKLSELAMKGPAGNNEVQKELWRLISKDQTIGLVQLIDYYLALDGKDGTDFKDASLQELHLLGLLPDPSLSNKKMQKRIRDNRKIVERLLMLTSEDRSNIIKVVHRVSDREEKIRLQGILGKLYRIRFNSGTLDFINFEDAKKLFKASGRRPLPTRTTEDAAGLASEALVYPERTDDLEELFSKLSSEIDRFGKTSARTHNIRIQIGSSTESVTTVRFDIIKLFTELFVEGIYGGHIKINFDNIDDLLRRVNLREHLKSSWDRDKIVEIFTHIQDVDQVPQVVDYFNKYDAARTTLLPHLKMLVAEPLVVAAHTATRKKLLASVDAYKRLINSVHENYEAISNIIGSDVDDLVGELLLMDTVVIEGKTRLFAILSPVHPLFVWHYATHAKIIEQQKDRFDDLEKNLVIESARDLPNFLSSLYIPATVLGQAHSLTCEGRLNSLPYYCNSMEGSINDDGVNEISKLIKVYASLEPHSSPGLRIAFVDPPDIGPYLCEIVEFAKQKLLGGAHIVVFNHQHSNFVTRLDEGEENKVAKFFQASNIGRRFTIDVRSRPPDEVGPRDDEPFHIVVVFDRGEGKTSLMRPTLHPIQPLAVPMKIHYSIVRKTVELEPASGGLFDSYNKLVGHISEVSGKASYRVTHQRKELRKVLDSLAQRADWTVVADRRVDRDLELGALRIYTASDREREVAAFARSATTFRRPLREIVRRYNTFVTNAELDDLLKQLSELLDTGLLNVKPDNTGAVDENRIKGLLATLIAVRWYRNNETSAKKLLISLDSQDARHWMKLRVDPLRADLVGFEWTNNHCTVTVIEVKCVEIPSSEYVVNNGEISGPAVDQMLATRCLIADILSKERDDELLTMPARREILRKHLYKELTKSTYSPEDRKQWAYRFQRLLDGEIKTKVACNLVSVRLGASSSDLHDRSVYATNDANEKITIRINELNEEQVRELKARESATGDEDPLVEKKADQQQPTQDDKTAKSVSKPSDPARAKNEEEANRPRIFLGTTIEKYGKPKKIWFDPDSTEHQLPNPHISIMGESGSGKTQTTKAIISELRKQDIPALILDFKDDYSDEEFVAAEDLMLYDATNDPLPFNPLIPPVDRRQNHIIPKQHVYSVVNIIKRIYKLGDQQANRLRKAVQRSYVDAGIALVPGPLSTEISFPSFDSVQEKLSSSKGNEGLLGRLSPIFDLGLFSSDGDKHDFSDFFQRGVVISLGQLPSDEVKNSVAEFFLMALHNHIIRQPQIHRLGQLLVLDEAWRVVESPSLMPLMREGRAFGLGIVIASQFPKDFPKEVSGSTSTHIFLSQSEAEHIREIQRRITDKVSGRDAEEIATIVRKLPPLSCLIRSPLHSPYAQVKITPYRDR